MRTLISIILVLLGTFSLYQFSVRTTLPGEISSTIDYKARPPLSDLGANYPVNGLLAAGALWGIGLGLFLALSTAPKFQSAGEGGLYKKTRRRGAIAARRRSLARPRCPCSRIIVRRLTTSEPRENAGS